MNFDYIFVFVIFINIFTIIIDISTCYLILDIIKIIMLLYKRNKENNKILMYAIVFSLLTFMIILISVLVFLLSAILLIVFGITKYPYMLSYTLIPILGFIFLLFIIFITITSSIYLFKKILFAQKYKKH